MEGVKTPSQRGLLEALDESSHCLDCGHPFWRRRLPQSGRWLGRCSECHARHAVQGGNPVGHPTSLPPSAVQDHDRLRERSGALGNYRVPARLDPVSVELRREQKPCVTSERRVVERSPWCAVVENSATRHGCGRQPDRVRRFTRLTNVANDEKFQTRRDDRHLRTQAERPKSATGASIGRHVNDRSPDRVASTDTSCPWSRR